MNKGWIFAWLCFVIAVASAGAAAWNAYYILEPAIVWRSAPAKSENARLRYKHDGEGMLLYYLYAQLTFEAAGQRVVTEAGSDFHTEDFSRARAEGEKMSATQTIPVYWNPANPKQARFALAYDRFGNSEIAGLATAALFFALAGWWLRGNWVPAAACGGCGMRVKRYYRFCPHCRSALLKA